MICEPREKKSIAFNFIDKVESLTIKVYQFILTPAIARTYIISTTSASRPDGPPLVMNKNQNQQIHIVTNDFQKQ